MTLPVTKGSSPSIYMAARGHLEPMLAEANLHDAHAQDAGRLGMPVMLLTFVVW